MNSTSRRGAAFLVDAGLALSLLFAIGVVFLVDRFLAKPTDETVPALVDITPAVGPLAPKRLSLGVTPEHAEWDDMAKLLDTLGEGYPYRRFSLNDLLEPAKIAEYQVIFLTCSGYPEKWLAASLGAGDRPNTQVFAPDPEVYATGQKNLRDFVSRGGTLYASDKHFGLVASAFPEFVDFGRAEMGQRQNLVAKVEDVGLRELVGPTLALDFDQPNWQPAAFRGEGVVPLLTGEYQAMDGQVRTAPLLVKFAVGDGMVIFTSFHNEKNNNENEIKLLKYLVFAGVTAQTDAKIEKSMKQGGFAKAKQNLYSASEGDQSQTATYQCSEACDLQFVLGFQDQGARLRLTVVGPDGKTYEQEGDSTITIDVPAAAVGAWKYTITPLEIKSANFPFTITVGRK